MRPPRRRCRRRLSAKPAAAPLGGCDESAQADRRGRVRVPDPAGGRDGLHREGAHRAGVLLHAEGRDPRRVGRLRDGGHRGPGRRRRRHGRADAVPVRVRAPPARPAARRRPAGGRDRCAGARGDPAGRAVQGVPARHARVPDRGRQALRRLQRAGGRPAGRAGPGAGPCRDPHPGRTRDVPGHLRTRPRRRPRIGRADREGVAPADHRRRRLRPHLLPGEERVDPVGAGRTRDGGVHRTGTLSGDRGRAPVHRDPRPLHADRPQRRPPSRRDRTGRRPVHPPRQPRRRPRPAHPRARGEQGADPRRTLAVHRRTPPVQSHRRRLRGLQHGPRTPPLGGPAGPVRRTTLHRPGQAPGP
jgi:hypothetical protein